MNIEKGESKMAEKLTRSEIIARWLKNFEFDFGIPLRFRFFHITDSENVEQIFKTDGLNESPKGLSCFALRRTRVSSRRIERLARIINAGQLFLEKFTVLEIQPTT